MPQASLLYRKGSSLLVKDGFDWANPLKSKIKGPLILHGTSSLLLENIMKRGLDRRVPLLTAEERKVLETPLSKSPVILNQKSISTGNVERISLTYSTGIAICHARKGPEIFERIMMAFKSGQMPDLPEFRSIFEKLQGFLAGHKPVVLFIDSVKLGASRPEADAPDTPVLLRNLGKDGWSKSQILEFIAREKNHYCIEQDIAGVPPEAIVAAENVERFAMK
ncbi:MAG: hypothetical protein WCT52_01875 [Candidatus Micrarchaeia archaeon]|jgi:hypothetical protein